MMSDGHDRSCDGRWRGLRLEVGSDWSDDCSDWGEDRRSDGRVNMGSYGPQCLVGIAVMSELLSDKVDYKGA